MPKVSEHDLTARRQEILDGARRCFAEFGYEGATVRRLEAFTGKSRGSIFHHFGNKEGLFLALAREDADRMAAITSEGGVVEVLRQMLDEPEQFDWLVTRLEIARLLRTDDGFRAAWQDHQKQLDSAVRTRIQSRIEAGLIRTDVDSDTLATFLDVIMEGVITRLATGQPADHLTKVLDFIEVSLRTSPPSD